MAPKTSPQGGAGPSLWFPVGCTSRENLSLAGAASNKWASGDWR